jgi:predicted ATPase
LDGAPYITNVQVNWAEVEEPKLYPFLLPAVKHMGKLVFHKSVTYLIGENGSGKSTLLEGIATAYGFNPEGGSRNFNFETRSSHSSLGEFLRLGKSLTRPQDTFFLRAESFYNVASEIDRLGPDLLSSYGGKSLHDQSHGESFLSLFLHRLHGGGLYIFDEPEGALSPLRQMSVLARIHELVKQDSQFIIATHSPIILAYPNSMILEVTSKGLTPKSYVETDTYRVMHDFIVRPERAVETLLNAIQADGD